MQHTTSNIGYVICDMQLATLLFIHRSDIAAVRTPTEFLSFYLLLAIAHHFPTESRPFPFLKLIIQIYN